MSFGTIFLPNGERTTWGSVSCHVVTLTPEGEREDVYFGDSFAQNMQVARNEADALMQRILAKQAKEWQFLTKQSKECQSATNPQPSQPVSATAAK